MHGKGWTLYNVDRSMIGSYWFPISGKKASIQTNLYGCGKARLDFGNYWSSGHTTVHLNGNEIGVAKGRERSKTIDFDFNDGDELMLSIGSNDDGTIVFNSFTVFSC